jgi:glycosyltransferase involved in cell wall biosynthesis
MSVLAVVTARNEAGYIDIALASLIADGIEVVLIDHESVDGTRELAEKWLGAGLLRIETMRWEGVYDLNALLIRQREVFASSRHDWHVRMDADEWLRSRVDLSLAQFLEECVDERYSVVNFREYVFLPVLGVDMWGRDFRQLATDYYLFSPQPLRLMRAWRRNALADFVRSGGHRMEGLPAGLVFPEDQVLRHYLGLSWSHAITKRANRTYAPEDLARGWHSNRLDLRSARPVARASVLRRADPWDTRQLDDSAPSTVHFWDHSFA